MGRIVGYRELCKIYGVGKTAVFNGVKNCTIPHLRIGKSIRFDLDEVDAVFRQHNGIDSPPPRREDPNGKAA